MEGSDRMPIQGHDLIREMEKYAPPRFAMDKDPIGLQVGNPHCIVTGIMVCLDVTEDVISQAIEKGANWIISHHPIIYAPLKSLRIDQHPGRLFLRLLRHNMNVYVAHTNLDVAVSGVNDVLAEKIGLINLSVFLPHIKTTYKKLVVFVPESHHENVRDAISQAGAGWIGNYSSCTFSVHGTGTFCPQEGTDPYVGDVGQLEKIEEIRLETIINEQDEDHVIRALRRAHPYEEVAYDVYPLDIDSETFGLGRIGTLPRSLTLHEFAYKLKEAYQITGLRIVGDINKRVERVAVLGGSGGKFFMDAIAQNADVYITGDIDYHTAHDALSHGLAMIDPGHHVEHLVVERVCEVLRSRIQERIPIMAFSGSVNPFRFVCDSQ